MNTTAASIRNRPHSEKEISSKYREYTGYMLFSMWMCFDLKGVSDNERRDMLVEAGIHDANLYALHDLQPHIYDLPKATHNDINRLCGRKWRNSLVDELKEAWNDRASEVNTLPIIGKVQTIDVLHLNDDIICSSITAESERMKAFFLSSLKSYRKDLNGKKTFMKVIRFNKEKFEEGVQVFRKFYMNLLLKNLLLGTNLCKLKQHEIIHRSKKVTYVYIASRKRMISLFSLKQLSYFEFFDIQNRNDEEQESVHTIAGKVSVKYLSNGLVGIGYVVNENENGEQLEVLMEDDSFVVFPNSPRLNEDGVWELGQRGSCPNNDEQYEIIEFHPIRMKLFMSGWMHMTYNHLKLSLDNTTVLPF